VRMLDQCIQIGRAKSGINAKTMELLFSSNNGENGHLMNVLLVVMKVVMSEVGVFATWLVVMDENPMVISDGGDAAVARVGKKAAGRFLDGVLHDAFPV